MPSALLTSRADNDTKVDAMRALRSRRILRALPVVVAATGLIAALSVALLAPALLFVAAPAEAIVRISTPPLVERFFTDPALAETRAIIVLHDGKRVAERYAKGYGPTNRFISWSMAKSVTSTLVGQLVGQGKLQLDAPAPVPAWHTDPNDPRGKITLAQLLHMSSGLQHDELGDPVESSDTNRALFSDHSADMLAYAVGKPLEAAPGSKYSYSSLTSIILADIVQRTVAPEARTPDERRAAMRAYMLGALIRPAGIPSLLCEFDGAGTMIGGSFCDASAYDWARFGQMYLDNGTVNGVQVVPAAWVKFIRTPAPTDGGYGGHFWLNRSRPAGREPALFPAQGPADVYSAIGHLGQYVLIVPSKHLVVVRLGKTPDGALAPTRAALARLVNSFPDSPAAAP